MKSIFLYLLVFFSAFKLSGQNEFAATAFYKDFNKICADAQRGFLENKGKAVASRYEELNDEYKPKWMLPLADSGRVVFPKNTSVPYVLYYFEPAKHRLSIDQKGSNLRDAIAVAVKTPLFSRSETILVNNVPVTNTWIFDKENETKHSAALYLLSVYKQDGKYYLLLQINGSKSQPDN